MVERLNQDFFYSTAILVILLIALTIGKFLEYRYSSRSVKIKKKYIKNFYMDLVLCEFLLPNRKKSLFRSLGVEDIISKPNGITITSSPYQFVITQYHGSLHIDVYSLNYPCIGLNNFDIDENKDAYIRNSLSAKIIRNIMKAMYEESN